MPYVIFAVDMFLSGGNRDTPQELYMYKPTMICGHYPIVLQEKGILHNTTMVGWYYIFLKKEYNRDDFTLITPS